MYNRPHIMDFGQIDLHTFQLPGSSPENIDEPAQVSGGGDGGGFGLIGGLLGVAGIALVGRGDEDQPAASIPPNEETEKRTQTQK